MTVAIILYVLLRRSKSPFILPGVLLAAFAVTHLVLLATRTPIAVAQDNGWLFGLQPAAGLTLPWKFAALQRFPWSSLPSIAGDMLAVIFVTVTNFLLNTTGLEIATRSEANIERDLKVLGLANVAIAALGGYVSCTSFSRSMLVRTAGATGRIGGITVAAISAAVLFAGPSFLGYVPKYILGGLLFYLGADLVYQWLILSSRRLLLLEYLSLIAIAILIIYSGFIAGVLIGIVIGCATFALSASRVNAIKFNFDGSEYRSSFDRGPYELSLLADHGREIQGMTLQSYLFFGSANRLYQHVKALLSAQPNCRFLIFDFRLVTGIDSSATHSFAQIKQAAAACGTRIVLVNLKPELDRAFRTARFVSDDVIVASDVDRALEFCEQNIIEAHRTAADDERSLRAWWSDALGGTANADRLAEYCRRLEVPAGQIIARRRRSSRFDAFHPRGTCRYRGRSRRRANDAGTQSGAAYYDRRNGIDHRPGAQRQRCRGGRERALRAHGRELRAHQTRRSGARVRRCSAISFRSCPSGSASPIAPSAFCSVEYHCEPQPRSRRRRRCWPSPISLASLERAAA